MIVISTNKDTDNLTLTLAASSTRAQVASGRYGRTRASSSSGGDRRRTREAIGKIDALFSPSTSHS